MTEKATTRPRYVTVRYRSELYLLDLGICRRALVARQVDGDLDSMESLADACDISRSTASRFFSGRATSLTVTLKILKALHLKFTDVARPVTDGGREDGPAGAGAVRRPAPRLPQDEQRLAS